MAAEILGLLAWQTGAGSLVTAWREDREAAASPAQDSLFPFEKSHGKGGGRPGNCDGFATGVGHCAGVGIQGQPWLAWTEDATGFRCHIQTNNICKRTMRGDIRRGFCFCVLFFNFETGPLRVGLAVLKLCVDQAGLSQGVPDLAFHVVRLKLCATTAG